MSDQHMPIGEEDLHAYVDGTLSDERRAHVEGEGTLLLATSPWCNVKIDGVDKGPTPVSVKLPAGKHTVLLSNPEFKISRSLPVMILPNETTRKRLEFAQ